MLDRLRRVVPRYVRERYSLKFALVFLLLGASMGSIGIGATMLIQEDLVTQVDESYATYAAKESRTVSEWNDRNERLARMIANSPLVTNAEPTIIQGYLHEQKRTYGDTIQDIHFVAERGNGTLEIASSTKSEIIGTPVAMIDAPWAESIANDRLTNGVTRTSVYRGDPVTTSQQALIGYVVPVSGESGDESGTLVLTMRSQSYSDAFSQYDDSRTLIVDSKGRVIFSEWYASLLPYADRATPAIEHARTIGSANAGAMRVSPPDYLTMVGFVDEEQELLVGYSQVTGTDWVVLVHTPTASAYGYAYMIRDVGLAATFAGVVLIAVIGALLTRHTARSIDHLDAQAARIERGDFDVDFTTTRIDAIGRLYRGLESMARTLKEHNEVLQAERDNFAALFENTADGVVRVRIDDSVTVQSVNPTAESLFDRPEDTIPDHLRSLIEPKPGESLPAAVTRYVTESETLTGDVPHEHGGSTHSYLLRFVPLSVGGTLDEGYLVYTDISDRKRYEEALQTLNDATTDAFQASSRGDVAEFVVETVTEIRELPAIDLYLFDDDENVLVPWVLDSKRSNPDLVRARGHHVDTDSALWDAFVSGDVLEIGPQEETLTTVSDGGTVDSPQQTLCVPLSTHGVIVASSTKDASIDSRARTLASLLASVTTAALDRLERQGALVRREREVRGQKRRLSELIRINNLIRELDQSLIRATSRDDVDHVVTDRLASTDYVELALVTEVDPVDETLSIRTWAGDGGDYLNGAPLFEGRDLGSSIEATGGEPTHISLRDDERVVVDDVSDGLHAEPWRQDALKYGFRSCFAIPIAYDEHHYGTLTLYGNRPSEFDEMTRSVFGELVETIAYAIDAVETKRAMLVDSVVELTFETDSMRCLLLKLARDATCEITYEGHVPESNETSRLFFSAPTACTDEIHGTVEGYVTAGELLTVSQTDERTLFELTTATKTVADHLVKLGGTPRTITATSETGTAMIVVDLPRNADVQAFGNEFMERYPGAELVAKRHRERTIRSPEDFRAVVDDELTERQREVLQLAHTSGYFSWPRDCTGEELASSLGISQPAVNKHLRKCQQKIVALVFEDE